MVNSNHFSFIIPPMREGLRPSFHNELRCPKCGASPIVSIPVKVADNVLRDFFFYCIDCEVTLIRSYIFIEIPASIKKVIRVNVAYSKKRLSATTLKELSAYYEKEYFEGIKVSAYDGFKRNIGNLVWEHCIVKEGVKSALELGCSYGYDVKALRERGVEAVGIDISKYAISKRSTNSLVRASLTHLPFKDKSFELIWSISMLEHIPEGYMAGSIKEFERVASKQLHIVFTSTSAPDMPDVTGDITHVNEKPCEYWLELTPSWEHIELPSKCLLLCFGFEKLMPESFCEYEGRFGIKFGGKENIMEDEAYNFLRELER